jgi:hypothetical protein
MPAGRWKVHRRHQPRTLQPDAGRARDRRRVVVIEQHNRIAQERLEIDAGRIEIERGDRPRRPARPSELAFGGLEFARVREGRAAAGRAGSRHRLAVDGDRVVDAAHDEVTRDRSAQGGSTKC